MSDLLSDNGLIPAQDFYYMLAGTKNIRILDATYGPVGGMSAYDAYLGRHIEGAQYFDIDAVADQGAALPHTLPSAEYFADCVASLGISNDDHVVIYDQSGSYMASTRAWWMFRAFGHEKVYILDGGMHSWVGHGFKTQDGPQDPPARGNFTARLDTSLLATREELLNSLKNRSITVIDARPPERFHGLAPEPRASMRSGHIPHSINLPFGALVHPQSRRFKEDSEIEEILQGISLPENAKLAVSCGSGITACTVAFALFKTRRQNAAIYDGSWSEWGNEAAGTPVEVSA